MKPWAVVAFVLCGITAVFAQTPSGTPAFLSLVVQGLTTLTGGIVGTTSVGRSGGGELQVYDIGTQFAGTVLNIPTFAALRVFQPDQLNKTKTAIVEGYAAAADGGGGVYDWDAANTCATNAANVLCVLTTGHTTTGRWIRRLPGGVVDARAHGAKCDGVTDDAANLNILMQELMQIGGGIVVLPPTGPVVGVSGCVVSGANLTMRQGVTLRGSTVAWSSSQAFPQYANSVILLDPTRSVTTVNGSVLSDTMIWRKGLASAPANVADVIAATAQWTAENSVAVTVTSNSVIERVRVIGFNLAFKQTGGGGNWMRDIQFDANNGVDRGGGNSPTYIYNIQASAFWAPGMGGRGGVVNATPTAGTGYTTADVVQPSGGTCSIRPSLTVTASGGVPSALAVTNAGDCTVYPSGTAFTGGTGTGLQATLKWQTGGYRPGIGVYDHEGVALTAKDVFLEQFQTGIRVNNSTVQIRDGVIEGPYNMAWAQSTGILTENCASTHVSGMGVTAHWNNLVFNAKTDQSGATCNAAGGNMNVIGITQASNMFLGTAAPYLNVNLTVGPGAAVGFYNSRMAAGSGGVAVSDVVVGAGAYFTSVGLVFNPISMHNPWIIADPTATVKTCGTVGDSSGATLGSVSYVDTCEQRQSPATKTGTAYTVVDNDTSLVLNPSNTFTLTLPSAASAAGRTLNVKLIAAFAVNSATANIVPLSSATAGSSILTNTAGKWATLQSDGTNWSIMAAN